MSKKVFISFAIEDAYARDFLIGQAKDDRSPFEFVDMSVKEPWNSDWKTKCKNRISGCDAVIALISTHTRNADGAKYEMDCANELDIPLLGVHIQKDDKGQVPPQLQEHKVIEWTWTGIANFINSI